MITLSFQQPIASSYVVNFGGYGDVTEHAKVRGVSRTWIYRQVANFETDLLDQAQQNKDLQAQLLQAELRITELEKRLAVSVVLDDCQQRFESRPKLRGGPGQSAMSGPRSWLKSPGKNPEKSRQIT